MDLTGGRAVQGGPGGDARTGGDEQNLRVRREPVGPRSAATSAAVCIRSSAATLIRPGHSESGGQRGAVAPGAGAATIVSTSESPSEARAGSVGRLGGRRGESLVHRG